MSTKPETTFYTSVHKHLPPVKQFHREKMSNPYTSGTADFWYSGKKADLWVEYKFIVLPKREDTLIIPDLSHLQLEWLDSRYDEGRNVAVIVGCKEGGVIYREGFWDKSYITEVFKSLLLSRKTIAEFILNLCT